MSERARGHRFALTVVWYVLGSTFGGIALGIPLMVASWGYGSLGISPEVTGAVVVSVALAAVLTDLRVGPWRLPGITRQVDERWITKYRQAVYVTGFGAQIGFGFATVYMTGGLYLLATILVVAGVPVQALALATLFGFTRGLMIVAGSRLTSPAKLRAFNARFEALAPVSIAVTVAAELIIIMVVASVAGFIWLGLICAAVPLVGYLFMLRGRHERGLPNPLILPIATDEFRTPEPAPAGR